MSNDDQPKKERPKFPKGRTRLIAIAPDLPDSDQWIEAIKSAFDGGDIAALIIPAYETDIATLQNRAKLAIEQAHIHGIAVLISDNTQVAGRVSADGIHLENAKAALNDEDYDFDPKFMIGAGGARTRHDALELGEAGADYVFFGRIGYDEKPQAHPRNIALGEWWAQMVEVPCVVMTGSSLQSIQEAANTGTDFIAASAAIFNTEQTPKQIVEEINVILEQTFANRGEIA